MCLFSGVSRRTVLNRISLITLLLLGFAKGAAHAACVKITSPVNGATVNGTVAVATVDVCKRAWSEVLKIDGSNAGAFSPGTVVFNSVGLNEGLHRITVKSESSDSVVLGTASVKVNVRNVAATPTPTATPTSSCITITSPKNNSTVSGASVAIKTTDVCSGVWFENLLVDGSHDGSYAPGQVVFNSTQVSNGTHQITVTSQSISPGSVELGSASLVLQVKNSGSPTPTPTATPTPASHYSMLPPGATLPSESTCITQVNASPLPENAPWNENDGSPAEFNSNQPPAGAVPSYFYQNAPCCTELPHSDFAHVDGNYSGTTDDLIRITACKWGIDEDYVRAQAEIESGWHQDCAAAHGGTGCNEGGDLNNPNGCTPISITGDAITPITPNGTFCELQAFGGVAATSQYASWSIVQSKVYYEWFTWPMMEESTPFGLDYRYAEMRGCINGDQYSYFYSQNSSAGTDYQNAVNSAQSNPQGPSSVSGWNNLQYLAYGCIETHYSGSWYSGVTDSYLSAFLESLSSASWPGGNR